MLPSRNCKHCKTPANGRPLHDHCIAPWYEANREKLRAKAIKADRLAQKVEKAQDRAKRESFKSIHKFIAAAQKEFNAYIRERDKDKPCICCGRMETAVEGLRSHGWDCGHYRSTGSASHLRFREDNAHRQLVLCNRNGAGRAVDYRIGLISRIGLARVEALENDNTPHKWERDELRQIAAEYRAKLRQLKAAQE